MRAQEIVEHALAMSAADGCVVIVGEHTETNLRWAANSLTTNGQMQSRSVTVVSTFDGSDGVRAGVVTRSVTSAAELGALVHGSEEAGRSAAPSDDAAPLVENYSHDDDWAADPAETSVGVFEDFAPALGSTLDRWRADGQLLYGFAEHQMTTSYLGTSTGLRRRHDQPTGRLELNGKSSDLTRSAWSGQHTRDFADVDVEASAAALATRLGWAETHIDLPAGRYETILPPSSVADLMIYAYWTASARDAEEGRNVYAVGDGGTRIGERLATLPVTLRSDPSEPGLQCAPFEIATRSHGGVQSVFDNGTPIEATEWIRDGSLHNLARTRAWAANIGTAPALFASNLILDNVGATSTLEEMISSTERGLLLTSLWYIREVDPQTLLLTGLTRDGVYLVEDGQVRGAVNNFRFNESPIDLLRRATEAGATVPTLSREWSDYFMRTAMPALRIPDFNMSTVSEAQ
ncbi:MAG TPA: metallopeptidase TldD-related protein [Jatrophihabitantaceae bacterium]|jgi:predicted Zn-dependent protease|nr:metallopeptidase TldD-related protein [Jatrophihabitantaceae bacterium]